MCPQSVPSALLSKLNRLTVLNLSFNEIGDLPDTLGLVRGLQVLDLQKNKLQFLCQGVLALVHLKELYVGENELRAFPHEVKGLAELKVLDLANNQIVRVGRTLGTLKGLQTLNLQDNCIPKLPVELGRLRNLKLLDVSGNELETLPEEIARLHFMDTLLCQNNKITSLPREIGECFNLALIDCSHNKLTFLPKELFFLKRLKTMNLAHNHLMNLNGPIHLATALMILDLSHNQLRTLPSALGFLALKDIVLEGNADLKLPPQVLEAGSRAILSYLRTIGEQHRLIEQYMEQFIRVEKKEEQEQGAEEQALAERNAADLGAKMMGGDDGGGGGGGGAIVPAGGDKVSKEEIRKQVQQIKGWLAEDPKRARLVATTEERQRDFRIAVDQTRQMLQDKGLMYGNVVISQIQRAKRTSILNLKGFALQSLGPDMKSLEDMQVIDISNNMIVELDPSDVDMGKVVVLNAGNNRITSTSEKFFAPALKVLHLGFNSLETVSNAIGLLPNLRLLYLANNYLRKVPDTFQNLKVTDLYLSENCINVFPSVLTQIKTLAKLSLACNNIQVVPEHINKLVNLRFLDLSYNRITVFPSMHKLDKLERLNLSFNPFANSFPLGICDLKNLKELNLDYTGITTVSEKMGNLRKVTAIQVTGNPLEYPFNLLLAQDPLLLIKVFDVSTKELDLSHVGLDSTPDFLGRLVNLERLDLSYNRIATLPVEMGNLINLRHFSMEGNPLEYPFKNLRREPHGDLGLIVFLDVHVVELDLSNASLNQIPKQLYRHAPYMQALNLGSNRLSELGQGMASLQALTTLTLDNNLFREFPEIICNLINLEVLQFSGNEIQWVPDQIGDLKKLKHLILAHNDLRGLPDSLTNLEHLEVLVVQNNSIRELPEGLGALQELHVLDCACNDLYYLPASIGMLRGLEVADFKINEIRAVPEEIGTCLSLVELDMSNNMLAEVPGVLGELPGLMILKLAANSLEELPLEVCRLQLQTLTLYGNLLPNVPSAMNVTGPEACQTLLELLETHFRKDQLQGIPASALPLARRLEMPPEGEAAAT